MSDSTSRNHASPTVLVWMDLEMSGLDPERDVILEMATLITNSDLEVIAEGPELVIRQPESLWNQMDDWCREHHGKSGLWQKVITSNIELAEAEKLTLDFIKLHTGPKQSPLCGNSIWQDRRFIARYMRDLDAHLHYRLVDVSTIKELAARWYPEQKFGKKKSSHRALDDIKESIAELAHYRKTIFSQPKTDAK